MAHSAYDCSETHPAVLALRQQARDEGVANPDNLPFMLCPEGANQSALLVHGFAASPWEMRLFAEHLADRGIASLAVCLPGHGTTPEKLAKKHWVDWQNTVEAGYLLLRENFSSAALAGMSTGCLLSVYLAAREPVAGLVLFSPYLRIQHRLAPYSGWLRWLRPYHSVAQKDIDAHYYHRRPVAGVHQINHLVREVSKRLEDVTCPVLAFSGEGDQTVDVDSGEELVRRLGSQQKLYKRYGPDVPHILTREMNPERDEMFALASQFLLDLGSP